MQNAFGGTSRSRLIAAALVASTIGACAACAPGPGPELRAATAAQVLDEVRRPGASAVLVNVWATWCQPCREEFPDLMKVRRDLAPRGLRVVLVSADFDDDREEQVRKFLAAQGADFPSFLKEGKDEEFIEGLEPKWSGALPATLIYDGEGRLRHLWEGAEPYETIKQKVLDVIERHNPQTKEDP
jgi:thiol-disulfide isomerase/thioredoxin